jgi:hypothetical protein
VVTNGFCKVGHQSFSLQYMSIMNMSDGSLACLAQCNTVMQQSLVMVKICQKTEIQTKKKGENDVIIWFFNFQNLKNSSKDCQIPTYGSTFISHLWPNLAKSSYGRSPCWLHQKIDQKLTLFTCIIINNNNSCSW